jgi:hypothetical protein
MTTLLKFNRRCEYEKSPLCPSNERRIISNDPPLEDLTLSAIYQSFPSFAVDLPVFLFLIFGVGWDFTVILWAMGLKMTISATLQTVREAKSEMSDLKGKKSKGKTDQKTRESRILKVKDR